MIQQCFLKKEKKKEEKWTKKVVKISARFQYYYTRELKNHQLRCLHFMFTYISGQWMQHVWRHRSWCLVRSIVTVSRQCKELALQTRKHTHRHCWGAPSPVNLEQSGKEQRSGWNQNMADTSDNDGLQGLWSSPIKIFFVTQHVIKIWRGFKKREKE